MKEAFVETLTLRGLTTHSIRIQRNSSVYKETRANQRLNLSLPREAIIDSNQGPQAQAKSSSDSSALSHVLDALPGHYLPARHQAVY